MVRRLRPLLAGLSGGLLGLAGAVGFLLCCLSGLARCAQLVLLVGRALRGVEHRRCFGLFDLRERHNVVVLQQVADDCGRRCFASHGGSEHDSGNGDAVLFDNRREYFFELISRRVVGVVTELLDASGEGAIGNDRCDCFHGAVDAAGLDGSAHAVDSELAFDE